MSIIVFGASGFIGKHFFKYFSERGDSVFGTYTHSPQEHLTHFNLETPDLKQLNINLKNVRYGIICSAITDMDSCKTDKEGTYRVNVTNTIKLLEQLFERGIVPVFLSSDHVFDGGKGNYSESDERKPVLVYGQHKKEVEDFLMQSSKKYILARIGKVYSLTSDKRDMITEYIRRLQENETLRCVADRLFSPSYVGDIVRAVDELLKKNLYGCYNIASPESFSRFEIALLIKKNWGIPTGKVIPCSFKDLHFSDNRPLNLTLNTEKFIKATGFSFISLEDSLNLLKSKANNMV